MPKEKLRGAYDEVQVEDTLLLKDFKPVSMLKTSAHIPEKARVPAVDAHVHLEEEQGQSAETYLRLMDEVGLEACVTIAHLRGDELLGYVKRFSGAHPDRFRVVVWTDLDELEQTGKVDNLLENMKRYADAGVAGLKF